MSLLNSLVNFPYQECISAPEFLFVFLKVVFISLFISHFVNAYFCECIFFLISFSFFVHVFLTSLSIVKTIVLKTDIWTSGMTFVNLFCSFKRAIYFCLFVSLVIFFIKNWRVHYYNSVTLETSFFPSSMFAVFLLFSFCFVTLLLFKAVVVTLFFQRLFLIVYDH